MVFVFAAMVEFAFVLFVKRKQEWKNKEENCTSDRSRPVKISGHKGTKVSNLETKKAGRVEETKDQETRNIGFWSTKNNVLHDFHLTTKIDFVGFVIYCFSYFIFNFVYWIRVLD